MSHRTFSRAIALAAASVVAFASFSAAASTPATNLDPACDLSASHFTPAHATDATSHPSTTRIPRDLTIELSGFPSADAAAKCFGARYHDKRMAQYVTYIVRVGEGWGYLTPGTGARDARQVHVADLQRAAKAAGHALSAIAYTQPHGSDRFWKDDIGAALKAGDGVLYVTNARNETFRTDAHTVRAYMAAHGYGQQSSIGTNRFLAYVGKHGFAGTRVP